MQCLDRSCEPSRHALRPGALWHGWTHQLASLVSAVRTLHVRRAQLTHCAGDEVHSARTVRSIHCCCLDISFFLHFAVNFAVADVKSHCCSPSCLSSSCSFTITTATSHLYGSPLASLLLESLQRHECVQRFSSWRNICSSARNILLCNRRAFAPPGCSPRYPKR